MRSHINTVTLEGNAVRDSGYQVSSKGSGVLSFTLASNKFINEDNKQASFVDVVCFGKVAESVGKIEKGENVVVIGELKQNSWTQKLPDGTERKNSKIEIVAHTVLFKDTSTKSQGSKDASEKPVAQQGTQSFEDDVPF